MISDHDKMMRMRHAAMIARLEMCLHQFRSEKGTLYEFETCVESVIKELRAALIVDIGNEC